MQDASRELRQTQIRELVSTFAQHLAAADDNGVRPEIVRYLTDALERQTRAERRCEELFESEQLARAEARQYHDENRAKDRFLAQLSHELRTPLQPVLAAASALLRDPRIPSDLLEDVRTIQRNVQLEARLIDDLLDLTRITSGKLPLEKRPINVDSVIARSVEICEPEAMEKRLTLSVELRAERTWVTADPGRLQQILWNLIKNAVKFTPAGGQIVVRSANISSDKRIVVEVEDNGIGIQPGVLPRIFDAFEQGGENITRKFGGMGLGLAISKILTDRHDGTLEASSEGPGRGATFTLTLPTTDGPAPNAPNAPRRSPAVAARTLRILLIDDDHDSNLVLGKLLRAIRHNVTSACDCATALAAVEADAQAFDLIVCDLGLPDGSGLDLLPRLHSGAGVKAIALTGYGTEEDVKKSLAAGFDAHLTKPITLEQLVIKIDELLPAIVA